ncbi:steroid receptor RNA activator 1 [Monomorium pharaonis]|uniref:steroid receptor RNA activator 1 n=1 Tax=Monomorium pharaonis TaxID=307658 RepID=UPI001745CEC2|nr:steroid receptor RNA activator 1 [Monomorium pharaonis]XP_012528653.2 steroid receptor RNA activator 1 [Monomorium pharaonis]
MEEKKIDEISPSSSSDMVSSQRSLPTTYDPGWNDPPEWALSSQHNSSGTSTRRLLNKRVAFPLSSSQASSPEIASPLPLSNMPPPIPQSTAAPTISTAPHKPLLAPTSKDCVKILESEDNFDKDQALMEILASLESVITEKMEENKAKEIRRRLDTMKSNWLENKLNDTVQRNLLNLSKALLRKDVKEADKFHITLMTQHATACRTWMPAIRHIIFELKKENENSDVPQPEQSPLLFVDTKKN